MPTRANATLRSGTRVKSSCGYPTPAFPSSTRTFWCLDRTPTAPEESTSRPTSISPGVVESHRIPFRARSTRRQARYSGSFTPFLRRATSGKHTWGGNSWRDRIGNNVWAFTLTVDEARGLVYMPVSGPGANFYGGDRPGDNLFGNSTVAIDIRTGTLEWYFQNIHHELWDYNLPPAPVLFTIEQDGRNDSGARAVLASPRSCSS